MPKKIKTKLSRRSLPKVVARTGKVRGYDNFPLDHYSYSSMVLFSTNPILFKIKEINRERYDTTNGISRIIGQAFHSAMETYYGQNPDLLPKDESEAIKFGLEVINNFIINYPEGFIRWSVNAPNRQRAQELATFAFNSYIKEIKNNGDEIIICEECLEKSVDIQWRGAKLKLPVKLKGYPDKIIRTKDGKIKIVDYKTCHAFSDPEKIDGAKIIQAVTYYLLAYATLGEEPYSMVYEEVKISKNRDNGPQVKIYEIVFSENELYFDFFFRLYGDMTEALNGKMVYVPNIHSFFDNEIAIISYIHHLDSTEAKAKEMKKLKVDNITDLLKKKIQKAGNMRKLLKSVEEQFIVAKNINYNSMENHEKIATKLLEYGLAIQFDSKIEGNTVDLYRYTPSIGLKMSRIKSFTADIEQVMGKSGIRVLAPIPNDTRVGFEIPRDERTFPGLPKNAPDKNNPFSLAIGQDIMGENQYYDIRLAPHILVAGSSGSGKSFFLHSIIKQLVKNKKVDIHLFDPKQVEFFAYEDDVAEYRHNAKSICASMENLVEEMERRYTNMKIKRARDIADMPGMNYKIVIIDEYADLLGTTGSTSYNIQLLAQKGRACGIHLIIATQRASTKIISGDIKVNFPVKVIFRMGKEVDSRIMIDESGAEKLLGRGDMLFATDSGIRRLQGFNI